MSPVIRAVDATLYVDGRPIDPYKALRSNGDRIREANEGLERAFLGMGRVLRVWYAGLPAWMRAALMDEPAPCCSGKRKRRSRRKRLL